MSDDSNPDFIHLERFLSEMNGVLKDRRYQGEPESKILRAFQVLDAENKGYLTEDEFRNYLCKEGSLNETCLRSFDRCPFYFFIWC